MRISKIKLLLLSLLVLVSFTALIACSKADDVETAILNNDIKFFSKKLKIDSDINTEDSKGRTPLYLAALYGKIEVVDFLLKNGADPTIGASWKDYATPLHAAASQGRVEIIKLLIESGADPNGTTMHGITPLHVAARNRKPEAIALLLKHGGDVKRLDSFGRGVLQGYNWLSEEGNGLAEMIESLVDAGADVNSSSKNGDTPLLEMISLGSFEAVKILVENGASIVHKNKNGVDSIYLARNIKRNDIEKYLMERLKAQIGRFKEQQ